MSDSFDPPGLIIPDRHRSYTDGELTEVRETSTFHMTDRRSDEGPVKDVYCVLCGGDRFNVGYAYCLTALRCVTCGWERVFHDG